MKTDIERNEKRLRKIDEKKRNKWRRKEKI